MCHGVEMGIAIQTRIARRARLTVDARHAVRNAWWASVHSQRATAGSAAATAAGDRAGTATTTTYATTTDCACMCRGVEMGIAMRTRTATPVPQTVEVAAGHVSLGIALHMERRGTIERRRTIGSLWRHPRAMLA